MPPEDNLTSFIRADVILHKAATLPLLFQNKVQAHLLLLRSNTKVEKTHASGRRN